MRQIIISKGKFFIKAALLEQGKLCRLEYYSEKPKIEKGDIYKGVVLRVIPAMGAAFVELENEESGFLPLGRDTIKGGEILLVQVIKEAVGNKKPKLTREISFPGKNLVFLPSDNKVSYSSKLSLEKSRYWGGFLKQNFSGRGFILRSGIGLPLEEEIKKEGEDLIHQWEECQLKFQDSRAKTKIHHNSHKQWKQFFIQQSIKKTDQIICNDKNLLKEIKSFLQGYFEVKNFCLEETVLFQKYGIAPKTLLQKDYHFGNIHLAVEQTEALCAIDVDSGYQNSFSDFEGTAREVNLQACPFIAQMILLRDISGIILVDFMKMKKSENQKAVLDCMKEQLRYDWKKVSVEGITSIGLVQILRQRDKKEQLDEISMKCRNCNGTGRVLEKEIVLDCIEEEIRQKLEHTADTDFKIVVPQEWMRDLEAEKEALEEAFECKLTFIPQK